MKRVPIASLRTSDVGDFFQFFTDNQFGSRTEIVADAMTSMIFWSTIADTKNELHMVLSDSCEFSKNWMQEWNERIHTMLPADLFVEFSIIMVNKSKNRKPREALFSAKCMRHYLN